MYVNRSFRAHLNLYWNQRFLRGANRLLLSPTVRLHLHTVPLYISVCRAPPTTLPLVSYTVAQQTHPYGRRQYIDYVYWHLFCFSRMPSADQDLALVATQQSGSQY